jgi:glyoxylase-like metal-dependent hydrolase (beta-lactamase superfamily II)
MIPASHGGSLRQYLDSLERLRSLEPARLLPAHGREVSNPIHVLTTHLAHRWQREQQVMEALAAGRDTVESIADFIYDGLQPSLEGAARENVRAHLEKLSSEGRALEHRARWSLVGKL